MIAREVDVPPGGKPIEWRRRTNRMNSTPEAAAERSPVIWPRWVLNIDCGDPGQRTRNPLIAAVMGLVIRGKREISANYKITK
ncbi:hypothetical protein [Thiocapsa bogorovii]|uniref:hypothetical protein n=1 Tax=Thiocapsa bogorovii TaxID=521689 RepID=UPI001E339525|nr:hypothetical protein [Thiocapsa bogorovii]UHD16089.1 hypothetical protein LT988_23040 [Thiocapsa bogorovii]